MSKGIPVSALGHYYIGIMSGTSLDAIDLVIAQRHAQGFKQVAALAAPLPAGLRQQLLTICRDKQVDLLTLGEVDHLFALTCAKAVKQLLKDNHFPAERICAIGSHGQTIFHSPLGQYPFTLQIGDANLLAAQTGIPCVADFRRMDMAYGGQGAPLVPAFHQAVFAKPGEDRILLNIGGIANISLLTADNQVIGYDTGPGNMLMDAWINKVQGKNFDKNGQFAAQGKVHAPLLEQLLSEPYFALAAPKSTGREKFNLAWLEQQLTELETDSLSEADIQRTLLELTAVTISSEIKRHSTACAVFVCGGGALNPLLMARLQSLMIQHKVHDTQLLGCDPMFVEALAFAWLAEQRILARAVALKAVTGAQQNAILGCVYLP